jgi:energy-coupling factor transport system permease protein
MRNVGDLVTYYAYQDSPVHRLDPRVKGLWVLVGVVFIFSTDDWRLLLGLLVVNLLLPLLARLDLRAFRPLLGAMAAFGIVILIVQVVFRTGDVFYALGPLKLHSQGLYVTREVLLRLANLALLFIEYMMWTHPGDMTLMFVRLGLPYRYGMLIGLALRFFPVMQEELVQVQEAQEVRGQPLHRSWQKIAGLVPIMLPLTLRVLRRTTEVSLAMELRGFGYQKDRTYLREIRMRRIDSVLLALLAGLLTLQFVLIGQRLLVGIHH